MPTMRRFTAGLSLALALPAAAVAVAGPVSAQTRCRSISEPGKVVTQTPQEQLTLSARRVWPTTTGRSVTVAVIDTGVDGRHPQLSGALRTGRDLTDNTSGGDLDCVSHGTAVAGLIAARPLGGIGYVGVAPGATILPVRVVERPETTNGATVDSSKLAAAIRWAADNGARVITISLPADRSTAALAAAVRYAQDRDALLVAAAGTRDNADSTTNAAPVPDPPAYPAGYPGVLAVGAVDQRGVRLSRSPVRSDIDIVAPGGEVLSATRLRGHAYWSGTDVAAALVSGVAALVRSAYPTMTAVQVQQRLIATANAIPGGAGTPGYGHGMVDPYRAVTDVLPNEAVVSAEMLPARTVDEAALRHATRWGTLGAVALTLSIVVCGILAAFAMALAMRRKMLSRAGPVSGAPAAGADGLEVDPLVDLAEMYYSTPKPPRPGSHGGDATVRRLVS